MGISKSGKTLTAGKIILNWKHISDDGQPCSRLVVFYDSWQSKYDELQSEIENVEFINGWPEDINKFCENDLDEVKIFLFDDVNALIGNDRRRIDELARVVQVVSHHARVNILITTQHLFHDKRFRSVYTQCGYLIFMRSNLDFSHINREYMPGKPGYLQSVSSYAFERLNLPYFFLDNSPGTKNSMRVKSGLFPDEKLKLVFKY